MTTRDRIIEAASAEIGPGRRAAYWLDVLGYDPGRGKAWCGAFCLWALHQAGLALGHKWGIDGSGMIGPLNLRQTAAPARGDVGYLDKPWQHHFMIESVFDSRGEIDGYIYSIDGNQPDVRRRKRRKDGLRFYSIESLIDSDEQDTKPGPPRYPTLRIGSTDDAAVRRLQGELNRHGAKLAVDGGFGLKTDTALRNFQANAGLKPDGVAEPATWEAVLK